MVWQKRRERGKGTNIETEQAIDQANKKECRGKTLRSRK